MVDDEWEEMNAKTASVIRLNLLDKVIHYVIDEEKAETIWQKLRVYIWRKIQRISCI
jgi:hypothetical protein